MLKDSRHGLSVVVELLMGNRVSGSKVVVLAVIKSHCYLPAVRLYKVMLRTRDNS